MTAKELWESVAKREFPLASPTKLLELKQEAALEWGCYADSKLANLFDQYVMMKKLMDITWNDK